jgi:putative Mg2+ transporter-C (MgtC) family protein
MPVELEMALRILLAAALGGVIGFQRERLDKPAGFRTHILISAGAALFTVVSIIGFETGDTARVAAGIVAGIGFLGAGSIIRRGNHIEGLTTAATIWAVAGIGMAAGSGLYIISVAAAVIFLIVLLLPRFPDNHREDRQTEKNDDTG